MSAALRSPMYKARRRIQRMQDNVPLSADSALPAMREGMRGQARVEPAPSRIMCLSMNSPVAPEGANNTPRRSDPVAAPKRDGEGGAVNSGYSASRYASTETDAPIPPLPRAARWLKRFWKQITCKHLWTPVYHSYTCHKCGAWSYD